MIFDDLHHKLKGFNELFPRRFFLPDRKIAILGNDRYVGMFKVEKKSPDYVSSDYGKIDKDVLVSLADDFDGSKLKVFDFTVPDKMACHSCDDSGVVCRSACPECDGAGTVDLSNEYNWYYEIECKSCRGVGHVVSDDGDNKTICPDCYGSKQRYPANQSITIDGMRVRVADIRWFCNEDTMYYADKDNHRLAFKSGDVFGFILEA